MPYPTKIVYIALRTNLYHILFILAFFTVGLQNLQAQTKDTIPSKDEKKALQLNDSIVPQKNLIKNDSISQDSIPIPKEAVDAIIEHTAKDYIDEDVVNKKVTMYDEAVINYKDITIKAGKIIIDYKINRVFAYGILDSIGEYSQLPYFKQGGEESSQDSIVFNFKSEKAIIYGLKTEQNGIYTLGEKMKKMNDSTIFVRKIRFTTSEKKNPDFYLATNKAKIVPNKKIIIGTTNLVIADVPTPVVLPFAYLPLTTTKASGFIVPSYGESNSQGFFLQNGGYYFAGNDFYDLTVLGDFYSNSSWGLNVESSYKVRYKYNGRFSFRYENLIFGIKGFDDFRRGKNFNLRWSHSKDAKSNPNSKLSASVNLGSSKYYQQSLNQINTTQGLRNTLSSSISYYQNFVGTPFKMTLAATHTQNTNTETISMTLPSLQLNMDRLYPFAPKNGAKKNAIQKIGLNYSLEGNNSFTTTDDEFFSKKMFDEAKTGLQHTASMSTNIKFLKYFTISPNVNYRDVWYFKSIEKNYNENTQQVVTDTINGFKSFQTYGAGAAISTNVYGTFKFKKGKKLKAIRHTIRPSVSFNYRPDFGFHYQEVQRSADPNDVLTYTPFDNGIYGRPSRGLSNSIGISVANILEAKVRNDDPNDDEGKDKKITLLNNLNISTNYNVAADSLRWSPVNLNASTQLFKNKLSVNMGAQLDPYALNSNNRKYNVFNINNGGSLFRLTSARLTLSYSISSKNLENKKNGKKEETVKNQQNQDILGTDYDAFGQQNRPEENKKKDKESKDVKLYENSIPWNLQLSYSGAYVNSTRQDEISTNSLMASGTINLTPKWNIRARSGYDFRNKGVTHTSLGFSRDLDSWRLNFDWVPFGIRTSYYFFIGVKSAMLSDLKWDKRNVPDRRLF